MAPLASTLLPWLLALFLASGAVPAWAQLDNSMTEQIRALALAGSRERSQALRVEVEVGALDPRLHLAPCEAAEPFWPVGMRPWGKARVGIRCTRGPSKWSVYLPITVHVFGSAAVAAVSLPSGAVLAETDLVQTEVDLAEEASAAVTRPALAIGRSLVRPLRAGQSLRESHLAARQWFAAGDTVKVVALGPGFAASGEGQALSAGIEGQSASVRTESGRVVRGLPAAGKVLELELSP